MINDTSGRPGRPDGVSAIDSANTATSPMETLHIYTTSLPELRVCGNSTQLHHPKQIIADNFVQWFHKRRDENKDEIYKEKKKSCEFSAVCMLCFVCGCVNYGL